MSKARFTIISASAGAGKTYTLTQLLTKRLADTTNPLEPSQIIATTFTRKAAGELSERIQQGLVDAAEDPLLKPAESARLNEQILKLPGALIGTVNSVTDQILRMFAVDAGLSPELTVLSEDSEKAAFSLATSRIIADYEEENSALLARMSYSKRSNSRSKSGFGNSTEVEWGETLREFIAAIRRENIDLADLPGLAEDSISELTTTLGQARVTEEDKLRSLYAEDPSCALLNYSAADAREEILEQYPALAANLRDALEAGDIKGTSVKPLKNFLEKLPQELHRMKLNLDIAADRTPWKQWHKATEGEVGKAKGGKPVKDAVQETFPPHYILFSQSFQDDVAALIRLTYTAAADCLESYQAYKDATAQIDFSDQEQKALRLLRENQQVREEISARFELLIVDEFQDTNPIQLAVFMELAQLVSEVIWVGDPKQSIYGFRGSDPALMDAALAAITDPAGPFQGDTSNLARSWRSWSKPISLSNELFAPLFPEGDNARLFLPEPFAAPESPRSRIGGSVEIWEPERGKFNNGKIKPPTIPAFFDALAEDLARTFREEGFPSGGCAILLSTNSHIHEMVSALSGHGIPATADARTLLETREGTVLRAALLWLVDKTSTQSLLELIHVFEDHPAHLTWFDELCAAADPTQRRELLAQWAQHPSIAVVDELAPLVGGAALPQLVEAAIAALRLPERIASWSQPQQRLATLDAFVGNASAFSQQSLAGAGQHSLLRFLESLEQDSPATRAAENPTAVHVGTIHSAKGLEWGTVILPGLQHNDRFKPAGVWVDPAPRFDVTAPLEGRRLLFWPLSLLLDTKGCREVLLGSPLHQTRAQAEHQEDLRRLYVAFTRSREHTVIVPLMSIGDSFPALLAHDSRPVELLTGAEGNVLRFDNSQVIDSVRPRDARLDKDVLVDVPGMAQETSAHTEIDVIHRVFPTAIDEPTVWDADPAREFMSRDAHYPTPSEQVFSPARFVASSAQATEVESQAQVLRVEDTGPALHSGGGQDWDKVGDAVHAYLGVDLAHLQPLQRSELAEGIIERWGIGRYIDTADLEAMGTNWQAWVNKHFGDSARIETEVPFDYCAQDGSRAQGWMDALIVGEDGVRYLVDHKTYPGKDPEAHIRANYLGQMATYSRVLESAGIKVGGIFMHLPLLGQVWEVRF
ncbi:MAG: UvrD-helicase domain-containing protein [Corynebacterium flavescens]|uniref:UvrD-helicase domain-containing protein n=1 Tax=Corynebacterium flavescens TaxID=28028 RepID=UPI00264914F6|nr:UvrD-helicase domain-containing protein [Corynebacterium flavescens]MDN6099183.1 UvrD-helicase domain-containing protein [Corynebacterium flavescens]MDN6687644.1 UvrD-helicase domain-containing protein [Corynebacterium flavescens]